MNKKTMCTLLIAVAAALTFGGQARADDKAPATPAATGDTKPAAPAKAPRKEVVKMADAMQFKEIAPGVTQAVLWGDPAKGAYGAITKIAAGTTIPLHTHANDIKIVVLKGAYVYEADGAVQKIDPGSYILVPGGKQHKSGADDDTMFFETSPGKFTLDMVAASQ
jgi:quercetin dioxygenase-like cupin family protein